MSDGTIQTHDGDTSDTLSSTCTPIIFLPGVMGSRLALGPSRTWDPDSSWSMLRWPPLTMTGVQTNRAALSVAVTQSSPMTELPAQARTDIANDTAVSGVVQRELGLTVAPSSDQIQQFFGVTRNWASILWSFYGIILARLEAEFNAIQTANPVYAFGYDFRQSNALSGAKLGAFIVDTLAKHPGATQVVLVSHSMGGMVVRGALMGDESLAGKIRGVVHGAQPSNGAVVCYTRFLSGMSPPVEPIGFFDVKNTVISSILGQTGYEYSYILSGLPGPLQLLPNHRYQSFFTGGKWLDGLDSGADLNDVYSIYAGSSPAGLSEKVSFAQNLRGTEEERSAQTAVTDFAGHLATARAFHEQLAAAPNAAFHPNTVALYSTGVDTLYGIRFNASQGDIDLHNQWTRESLDDGGETITDHWARVAYTRRPRGDATVPDVSARCPAAHGAAVPSPSTGVEHGDVYKDPGFNARAISSVKQILQGPIAHADNDVEPPSDERFASNEGEASRSALFPGPT
jgi:hypothetical protein